MTQLANPWLILLASQEEMHRVWGRFDNERPGITASQWIIVIGVVAIALLAGMVWQVARRRTTRTFSSDSSAKLFRELCAAHALRRASRRLLKRLAEARGLTNPAMLFVEPQHFEAKSLPAELKSSAKELRQISEMLFD
jgi:hypothetical protein